MEIEVDTTVGGVVRIIKTVMQVVESMRMFRDISLVQVIRL